MRFQAAGRLEPLSQFSVRLLHKPLVQEYVMRLIDCKPEYLGRIIYHFVDRIRDFSKLSFQLENFCRIYDPNDILIRLERYGNQAFTTPEEQQATELFRQVYLNSEQRREEAEDPAEILEERRG